MKELKKPGYINPITNCVSLMKNRPLNNVSAKGSSFTNPPFLFFFVPVDSPSNEEGEF